MKNNTSKGNSNFILTAYGRNGKRVCIVQTARQVNILLDLLKGQGVTVTVVEVKKASHITREYRADATRCEGMVKLSERMVRLPYDVRAVKVAYNAYLKDTRPGRVVRLCKIRLGRHAA